MTPLFDFFLTGLSPGVLIELAQLHGTVFEKLTFTEQFRKIFHTWSLSFITVDPVLSRINQIIFL